MSQNSSPSQAGWVKWWRVTTGEIPRSPQASSSRAYRSRASVSNAPSAGSRRAHSTERRSASQPSAATRSSASSGCRQKSQATPDRVARPLSSHPDQLLAGSPGPLNPPSTW